MERGKLFHVRPSIGTVTVRVWRTEGLEHIIILIISNQRAGQGLELVYTGSPNCLGEVGSVGSEKCQRIELSLPRAGLAGLSVPRQNTQLWELILGNYNPGDWSVQGSNTGGLRQDQNVKIDLIYFLICVALLCVLVLSAVYTTVRQYFCLNKINKLSKFDINSNGWMVMDFLRCVECCPPQHSLHCYQSTALPLSAEFWKNIKYKIWKWARVNHNCLIIKYWLIIIWLRMSKKINILSWFLCDVYQTFWHQAICKKWQDVDFNFIWIMISECSRVNICRLRCVNRFRDSFLKEFLTESA